MTSPAVIGKTRDTIGSRDYNIHEVMKRMRVYIFPIVAMLMFAACGQKHNDEVLVVEKTKSYHTDECPRVNMAETKLMTEAEAKALNCKPCPGCKPDQRRN